jgi:hypothetical protein
LATVITPPAPTTLVPVVWAILSERGADIGTSSDAIAESDALELLVARLRSQEVSDLVLFHAEWLPRVLLDRLVPVLDMAVPRVWLVYPEPAHGSTAEVDGWAVDVPWAEFAANVTPERRGPGDVSHDEALPPALREVVVRQQATGRLFLLAWAIAHAELSRTTRRSRSICAIVRSCVDDLRFASEWQDSLLGLSLALASYGYAVLADPVRYRGICHSPEREAVSWSCLDAILDPWIAAATTLHIVGLSVGDIARLRILSVSPDGSGVVVGGSLRVIPTGARAYLRAQRYHRLARTADLAGLFAPRRAGGLSPRSVAADISVGLAQLGRLAPASSLARPASRDESWLADRGVRIEARRVPLAASSTTRVRRGPESRDPAATRGGMPKGRPGAPSIA